MMFVDIGCRAMDFSRGKFVRAFGFRICFGFRDSDFEFVRKRIDAEAGKKTTPGHRCRCPGDPPLPYRLGAASSENFRSLQDFGSLGCRGGDLPGAGPRVRLPVISSDCEGAHWSGRPITTVFQREECPCPGGWAAPVSRNGPARSGARQKKPTVFRVFGRLARV